MRRASSSHIAIAHLCEAQAACDLRAGSAREALIDVESQDIENLSRNGGGESGMRRTADALRGDEICVILPWTLPWTRRYYQQSGERGGERGGEGSAPDSCR